MVPDRNSDKHRCPAEAATRLGVSAKALRLYERPGLVAPRRTRSGWRTYGPAGLVRIYQVLALKRLGLSRARIAELLAAGRTDGLDRLLAVQEAHLAGERTRGWTGLLIWSGRPAPSWPLAAVVDDLS